MSPELTYFITTTSDHSNNIIGLIENQPGVWYDGTSNCIIQFQVSTHNGGLNLTYHDILNSGAEVGC
jgi:hypothetical protein